MLKRQLKRPLSDSSWKLIKGNNMPILNMGRDVEIFKNRSQMKLIKGGKS